MTKQPLWTPSPQRVQNSNIYKFMQMVNDKYQQNYTEYQQLHQWSLDNIEDFWSMTWDFAQICASQKSPTVAEDLSVMPGTKWFPDARLNFAENLLRYRDQKTALIFCSEEGKRQTITYETLYHEVAKVAAALRQLGVVTGDRVVGFMPNMIETIIAMLATTSIGAVWSSCSPEFGIKGVLDRFGQIQPKVLFTANGYFYSGKQIDSLSRISDILKQLPSIQKVVVVPYTEYYPQINAVPNAVHYKDFCVEASDIEFTQLPFDHPLYIMYSSGTTGLPKCMVQGAGGILINHLKELLLHVDLKRSSSIFYFTTCGWMMWNWLVSSLAVGATLLLYDGSPFYPEATSLWQMAEREQMTIFGTSARYLGALEQKGERPGQKYDLSALKTILSTGSPLPEESFHYVYRDIKEDIHLASISGGTDLNGCFVGGNPMGSVYPGEIQAKCLAMNVDAFNNEGKSVTNEKGELVCKSPFPSMPIYFWNDRDKSKYHKAYFDYYPNVWRHGDYIETTENNGIIIYGRSDATLNPGGVRIGTAEIYRQVENFPQVVDSVVVGQEWENDTRVILFVKLKEDSSLTEELVDKMKTAIRNHTSVRHVPAKIIEIADIPYTISMKKVEIAVREIIHSRPVYNQDALINPESLELYKNILQIQEP